MKLDEVKIQAKIQCITNSPVKVKVQENRINDRVRVTINTVLFKLTNEQLDQIRMFLSGIIQSPNWAMDIMLLEEDDPFWHLKWADL